MGLKRTATALRVTALPMHLRREQGSDADLHQTVQMQQRAISELYNSPAIVYQHEKNHESEWIESREFS